MAGIPLIVPYKVKEQVLDTQISINHPVSLTDFMVLKEKKTQSLKVAIGLLFFALLTWNLLEKRFSFSFTSPRNIPSDLSPAPLAILTQYLEKTSEFAAITPSSASIVALLPYAENASNELPRFIISTEDIASVYHTVESGESVWEIAQKYNVNPEPLRSANGISPNELLMVGQVIKIPNALTDSLDE